MFLQGVGERMKKNIEKLIRKYCPDYTYDKLEEDHELTGYEGNEKNRRFSGLLLNIRLMRADLRLRFRPRVSDIMRRTMFWNRLFCFRILDAQH